MKLAIAGTGFIVSVVLPLLRELEIPVAAICGTPRSAAKVSALCGEFGIPEGTVSYDELIASPEADTVYIATPNSLHHEMAKKALLAGKHVIVEKPLTSTLREAEELRDISLRTGRLLFEAVSTLYIPDYLKVRELLPKAGRVRLVSCNYSQYSSRYGAFMAGDVKPVFDPLKSGGALMDLGIYNIHYITCLFGTPETVSYTANIERGVDTGGVLVLGYPDFKAVSVAAKDCAAPGLCLIEGTEGFIVQNSPSNVCEGVHFSGNDGSAEDFHEESGHRLRPEFEALRRMIDENDSEACARMLKQSLIAEEVLERARRDAGIVFPADAN